MVVFGSVLGLALLELSLRVLNPLLFPASAGTTFQSLDEVRRAILSQDGDNPAAPISVSEEVSRANLRDIVNAHQDDRIIFDLKPNLEVQFQRAQVSINSCGMRDVERAVPKPLDTYRIALLGDSFTFGWGVEASETFARRLEDNLNRMANGAINFEVLNFGVPGYTTFQEVALFKESGLDFNPDEVLVFFVQNDFDMPFFVQDLSRPGGILASSEFLRLGMQAVDPQYSLKFKRQQSALRGLDPSSALTELSDITRDRGLRLSLAINPRKEWRVWRDQIPVLRERKDIRVFSLRADFMRMVRGRKIRTEDLTLSFDPHPSPLRHAMYGDLLTPYFMDVLPD